MDCFFVFEQEKGKTFPSTVLVVIIIYITWWLIIMETQVKGETPNMKKKKNQKIILSYNVHPQPSRHYDAILLLKGPAGWLLPNFVFFLSMPGKEAKIIREQYPLSVKNTIKLPSERTRVLQIRTQRKTLSCLERIMEKWNRSKIGLQDDQTENFRHILCYCQKTVGLVNRIKWNGIYQFHNSWHHTAHRFCF